MTEKDGGWVRPSAHRPGQAPDGGTDGGESPRERRPGRGGGGRPRDRAGGASTATTTRPADEAPPWADAPTDPTPVVNVGGGTGGGGGGTGGGGGGGNGDDQAARRTMLVAITIGVLTIPLLLLAVITIAPNIFSSGGSSKPTPKSAPSGQLQLLLRPGLTVSQIGDVVGNLPGHDKASFTSLASSGTIRSKYLPASVNSLEGVLYPDTYFVLPNEGTASITRRLVSRFDQIGDQVGLGAATAVTPYQTVIVASLVQQEAKLPSDAPLVASVIYNRLKARMPLQIDATLCYAKGGCPPVPTAADKKLSSAYNTYRVAGLPPTPIASVTATALQAALQPPNVPYLYYVVADSSGKLAFATTLQQQNHNIAAARQKGIL
ncbi:MAG TPA: endolytic transglycosylase MltG [Acidimicrobiia bacterium]|nr:endolytic transglycosylase MltG [Acidimicrobiia bacterium]HEV3451949.1 endolytic transglycosylase MltG [Acidimicrobiia bacterium]